MKLSGYFKEKGCDVELIENYDRLTNNNYAGIKDYDAYQIVLNIICQIITYMLCLLNMIQNIRIKVCTGKIIRIILLDLQQEAVLENVLLEISVKKQLILAFTPSEFSDEIANVFNPIVISSTNYLHSNENTTYFKEV